MKNYTKLYINGEWVAPDGEGACQVINPANNQPAGSVPLGNEHDVDAAVQAANNAFLSWSQTSSVKRAEFIGAIAARLNERKEEMGALICSELGMPMSWSVAVQAGMPAGVMASHAEFPVEMELEESAGSSLVLREPIGVCGFITPWNYPLHQIVGKVAPALAAGCTMVVKPSSEAPLNAFLLAEIIDEVGLPPGVFNLVSGPGKAVGEAISSHPNVDMVSFTGSTRAGIRIAELAAPTVKRVTQELGGKSANLILEDADLEAAVTKGVSDVCINSGQTCAALTRMLVPAALYEQAVQIAKQAMENTPQGDPLSDVFMGPMVSEKQRETVCRYIEKGIQEGATLVTGGVEKPSGLESGAYVKPTLFSDVNNGMVIAREEIFGPVLCMIPYETEEEGIEIANDSVYGLSGAVWSQDADKAKAVARRVRTGQVSINGGGFNIVAPFGGYKQSGNGRELGRHGLDEFIEIKSLQLN
ncbi:MAG: aldehyde dehydrogenase family protein [Pseudomonadales bacterium]|nr:aldehyde dehydrogenase family protein [Pseudomonadales bacterium]